MRWCLTLCIHKHAAREEEEENVRRYCKRWNVSPTSIPNRRVVKRKRKKPKMCLYFLTEKKHHTAEKNSIRVEYERKPERTGKYLLRCVINCKYVCGVQWIWCSFVFFSSFMVFYFSLTLCCCCCFYLFSLLCSSCFSVVSFRHCYWLCWNWCCCGGSGGGCCYFVVNVSSPIDAANTWSRSFIYSLFYSPTSNALKSYNIPSKV